MNEYTAADKKMVTRHDEILRGNGDDVGIRAQVKTNTNDLKTIKGDIRWLVKLAIGAILLQLIAIAMNSGAFG